MYAMTCIMVGPNNDGRVELCGPYIITKYQGRKARPHWRKARDYSPPISDMFPHPTNKYEVRFNACEGILLVVAQIPG